MSGFPNEILDLIIYFSQNRLYILKQVNKYFSKNCVKLRLNIEDDDFNKLFQLTVIKLIDDRIYTAGFANNELLQTIKLKKINDNILQELVQLRFLGLGNNKTITDKSISELIKLKFIDLSTNQQITDEGLYKLTNLTKLKLRSNNVITDKGIARLDKLIKLDLENNHNITIEAVNKLRTLKTLNIFRSNIDKRWLFNIETIRDGKSVYDSEEDEEDNYT